MSLVSLVDKATSEYLVKTDWTVVMEICDTLNREQNPIGCRDVMRQATKKMKEKEISVSLYALELIETLVKNCECIHPFVGGKEFQDELVKLIQNKSTKDPIKAKALELVQYWADSFQSRRDLPLFNQTNLTLRRAGVTFPPRRADDTPLQFRNPAVPMQAPAANPIQAPYSHPAPPHQPHPAPYPSPYPVPYANPYPAPYPAQYPTNFTSPYPQPPQRDAAAPVPAPALQDFGQLQESVNLAVEILSYLNPEEEDPATNEILTDVINTCKSSGPNVRTAIESGNFSSESQMVSLLSLNDELVRVLAMYDESLAKRKTFLMHGPQPKTPAAAPTTAPTTAPAAKPPSASADLVDLFFGDLSLNPAAPIQPTTTTATTSFTQQPHPTTTTSSSIDPLADLFLPTTTTTPPPKPSTPPPTQYGGAPPAIQPAPRPTTPTTPIQPIPGPTTTTTPIQPLPYISNQPGPRPTAVYYNPGSHQVQAPPPPAQAPAADFDEFDMLANRHSTDSFPPLNDAILQPTAAKPRATSPYAPSPTHPGPSTFPSG